MGLLRFSILHISLSDYMDYSNIVKLLVFYIPVISIVIYYNKMRLLLLYSVLYIGLLLNIFYSYHNWLVYQEVNKIYIENSDQPIISIAEFNWINRSNTNLDFAPYKRDRDSNSLNSGLIIFGESKTTQAFPVSLFREFCVECNIEYIDDVSSSFSPFVEGKFKRLKVYKYSGFKVDNSPFN